MTNELPDFPPLSNRQFAALVGCDSKTVTNLRRKGMPSPKEAFADAVRWYCVHIDSGRVVDPDARRRIETARAELLELEVERTKGEVVPLADMKVIAAEMASLYARSLDALGPRLAGELAGITDSSLIRDRLRRETHAIRRLVADECERLGRGGRESE
jgi:hypothetical protein